jgi:hypothetical protein
MWMPKDAATWLAVIALVLTVPLNFLSAWLYPKTQDWWAARSRRSLKRRIEELKAFLAISMREKELTVAEVWILKNAERVSLPIVCSYYAICTLVAFATYSRNGVSLTYPKIISLVFASCGAALVGIRQGFMFDLYRFIAGPRAKDYLMHSISVLERKLEQRNK